MSYDLVEQEEPLEPKQMPTKSPGQPMPRIWKAEADSTDDEPPTVNNPRQDVEADGPKKQRKSKHFRSKTRAKTKSKREDQHPAHDENGEKKVLIEETPTLDTYESRRRARMIIGAVVIICTLCFGWTVYRVFLRDPAGLVAIDSSPQPAVPPAGANNRSTLDQEEAQFMYARAQELDQNGQTDQAVAMLNQVIKAYKATPSARDSRAALDRFNKKLPLFGDGPAAPVSKELPTALAATTPRVPAVSGSGLLQQGRVQTNPVLPANPGTGIVTPPGFSTHTAVPVKPVASRPLPSGFRANPNAALDESGWPLVIVCDRDGGPMVLVPGGTFSMGNKDGPANEAPPHPVRLSPYFIDQHEVTNRQFRTFLRESDYRGRPVGKWLTDAKARAEPDDWPVGQVTFDDAQAFSAWAGKQLPTEAQWELAARSTDGRRFPWGNEPMTWSRPRTFREITAVMTYPEDRSPFGVFDMAGNAHEWTSDIYDPKYYHLFAGQTAADPAGPPPRGRTPQHVIRGSAKNWSATSRDGLPSDVRLAYLGFRCVLNLGPQRLSMSAQQPMADPSRLPAGQALAPPTTTPE